MSSDRTDRCRLCGKFIPVSSARDMLAGDVRRWPRLCDMCSGWVHMIWRGPRTPPEQAGRRLTDKAATRRCAALNRAFDAHGFDAAERVERMAELAADAGSSIVLRILLCLALDVDAATVSAWFPADTPSPD